MDVQRRRVGRHADPLRFASVDLSSLSRRARSAMGRVARAIVRPFGYEILRRPHPAPDPPYPDDYDDAVKSLFEPVRPYTLTSHERVLALRDAVRYLAGNGIAGAFVECGV